MSKIKVLHIIKSLGRGGAEMLLQEILPEHDQNTFEFHFIYFLPWKNQMVSGIEQNGGKVVCMSAKNNIEIMLKAGDVIQYIKQHDIRLIHCHLPWAGFLGRYIHFRTKLPVLYTEHNIQERYHWITKWLNKASFNRQTAVIAVSDDVESSIRKTIQPRIPIHTILNGVNTSTFIHQADGRAEIRKQLGLEENHILIGVIAVFRFQKRLTEWIEVFSEIHAQNPNVRGCIIGDGILKNEIVEKLKEKRMEDFIFMPGLQTNVKPWLSAMDIFMMSSSFEGLPIALLEAMSMGCAIVSTDAGGIKQVIRNGVDGYTVSVEDWRKLSELCLMLANDNTLRRKMGERARERTLEAFSLGTMAKETEQLYKQVIIANGN
jgi:glycosyltransferase involved in cell wall biosynthesis